MIQLQDLTHDYIQSQLKKNYEEFSHISFDEVYDRGISEDMYKDGSSSGVIAYLTKKRKTKLFDNVALCFRFKGVTQAKALLSQLKSFNESLKKAVSKELITQTELDDSFYWGTIDRCINTLGLPLISDNNFFSISVYYVKCNQIDDSSFSVSIGQHRTKRQASLVNEDVIEPLAELKDALLSALAYSQEKNLVDLEQGYSEALEVFEAINTFMLSQLSSLDIEEFVKREFYVCDVEVDDPAFQEMMNKFDTIKGLRITEVSDPINSNEFLARPKALIEELQDLCDKTIVKRLNNQNRDLPNVKAIADVKYELYGSIAYTSNSIKKNVLVNLNSRIKSAPAKSREKQVLRHFKEAIAPYIEELLKIHEELQPYIGCPYQGSPPKLVVDAINIDMENGNNNEKLRIIDEVSVFTKALEQLSNSLNAAYYDMLVNAYSE